jgi:hypothetical protein
MPFLHGVRDAIMKDQRPRSDDGREWNAITASGNVAQDGSYI